jgi:FkbM family methyltransferase
VLELGANVGQKSLLIASLVNQTTFVALESNAFRASKLIENKSLNQFNFFIENAALSNRTLITQDFQTIPSETLLDGYQWVPTITWNELTTKYNIAFDTLVVNCNGAFYYILMDTPEILTNITILVMTNDYEEMQQKDYVNSILTQHNFYPVYVESGLRGGYCSATYYEVWRKH